MSGPVITYKYDDGSAFAVIGEERASDGPGGDRIVYARIGQHSGASQSYIDSCRAASPDEAAPLRQELATVYPSAIHAAPERVNAFLDLWYADDAGANERIEIRELEAVHEWDAVHEGLETLRKLEGLSCPECKTDYQFSDVHEDHDARSDLATGRELVYIVADECECELGRVDVLLSIKFEAID